MKTPFEDDTFVPDEESWVEPETQAELARLRKTKVHEPMDEALFWQILEKSRDFMYDSYKQEDFLGLYLDRFTLTQMIGFRLTTQKLVFEAYTEKAWSAGSILNETLYDVDEFQSFLCLVISRGKAVYQAFLQNPDSLIDDLTDDMELYDFDGFNNAAEMAFQGKADADLYEIINLDDYAYASKNYPEMAVTWGSDFDADDEATEEQLQAHCPRLYEKYWKNKNNDKAELKQLGKVSTPMDESVFWQIIEKSRDFMYDMFKQKGFIALYLERFSLEEIIGFRLTTQKFAFGAYNQKSWYAGSVLNEILYDVKEFESFLYLVISRGKAVYQAFLQNPDSLVDELSQDLEFYDFDHFNDAAEMAFDMKADAEIDEFIDFKNFAYSSENYPEIEVQWGSDFDTDDAEEQLQAHCPRLYAKYWKNKNNDKAELKQLGKVSTLMDESVFWQIIEKSRDFIYDTFQQEEFIALYLERFSLKEIIGFRLTTQKLIFGAYNQKSWYAGTILNNVLDDVEDFEAFLCLIISRGKAVYQAFLQNPDSLVDELSQDMDFYDFDHFNEAADTAFDMKTDAELNKFIDFKNFAYSSGSYPKLMVPWGDDFYDTNAEEQLKLYCPKLYEKYWMDDDDDDDDEY